MRIEEAVADFRKKVIEPLFADISRTLEVTCWKSGDDNHGSNFVGNAVVLMGIEAVAQFIDPATEEEHSKSEEQAREVYRSIDKEKKKYLMFRRSPTDGSDLAKTFMKTYFDESVFQEKELGALVYELIWAFRNPHMHAFYPYYHKKFNGKMVSGAVKWLYLDDVQHVDIQRTGITIKRIEDDFSTCRQKLYRIQSGDWFIICPQILFVFFKQAVNRFIEEVGDSSEVQRCFLRNCGRLAKSYRFQV